MILVVPDGVASFDGAHTPALDRLAARGATARVRTIPAGLPAGTEVGFPTLLGIRLEQAPARGRLEAAAAGIEIGAEQGAWRLDVLPAGDLPDSDVERLDAAVAELGGHVHRLRGHRCLLVGPHWWGDAPPGPHQTDRRLREFAIGPFGGVAKAAKAALYPRIAWPWGRLGGADALPDVPALLGRPVTVVPGSAAVQGIARLTGCTVAEEVPDDHDGLLVVHDGRPDEAAHTKDPVAYAAAIETFDREVLAPLLDRGVPIAVCGDHGCDPVTGRHTEGPVTAVSDNPDAFAHLFGQAVAA